MNTNLFFLYLFHVFFTLVLISFMQSYRWPMKIKEEYSSKSLSNSSTSSSKNTYLLDVGHCNIDASSGFVSFSPTMVRN